MTEPPLSPPSLEERLRLLERKVTVLQSLIKPHEKENELRKQSLQLLDRLNRLTDEIQWNGAEGPTRLAQLQTIIFAQANCQNLFNILADMRRAFYQNPEPPF